LYQDNKAKKMKYTIYNIDTGRIISTGYTAGNTVPQNFMSGRSWVEGEIDGNKYYIVDGLPVEYPPQPSELNVRYKFDWNTHQWVVDLKETEIVVRRIRNQLFTVVDKINPMWYDSLSTAQKNQVSNFRSAVIAITDQPDFPLNIVWPEPPNWL
jgi:hypothetical protein